MFKKALRIAAVCGMLTAGYFGYCRGFAAVQRWVGGIQRVPILPRDPNPSRTARETAQLARAAFGPDHWTADPKQATWYYDADRGYWMFFKTYDKSQHARRIAFSPFALIWRSKGKANLNTVLADRAWVDFDKPFDLSRPGSEAARVTHAVIEGQVRLRDDKGTPGAIADDLTIGPLTHLEYDEAEREIRSTSSVELREGDLVARSNGLKITLRPKPPTPSGQPGGFSGAETIWLLKDITISVADVGKSGIVPGTASASTSPTPAGPRPGELTCDGPARIDLPAPRPQNAPPAPPDPIIAQFYRNVVLRQAASARAGQTATRPGEQPDPLVEPDQINADTLRLTLVPAGDRQQRAEGRGQRAEGVTGDGQEAALAQAGQSTATDEAIAEGEAAGGPLSGLVLQVAEASGHAVWLQSPSQGLKARGNELRYKKQAPEKPDVIFFLGTNETWIERVSLIETGPDAGKVRSVDTIRTRDVTIHQGLKPGEPATVVARGPGSIETRPDRGQPVSQSAEFGDQLVVQTVNTAVGPRRRVTLTGTPKLVSPTQGTLVARDQIIAYLKPGEAPPKAVSESDTTTPPDDAPGLTPAARDPLPIDWLEATGAVRMAAVPPDPSNPDAPPPGAREIIARERLNVVFAPPPEASQADAPAEPAEAPTVTLQPVVAANEAVTVGPPAGAPAEQGAAATDPQAKPPSPAMRVEADEVWAKVALSGPESRPELQEVRLRREVLVHQDAEPGRETGLDLTAAAVDLQVRGEGRAWVEAHGDPEDGTPARAITDTFAIEGPKLGLDQSFDHAWVRGPGRLDQKARPEAPAADTDMAQTDGSIVPTAYQDDLLARTPEAGAPGTAAEAPRRRLLDVGRGPITITWAEGMEFFGQPPESPEYAYARFLGDVRAVTDDSSLACQKMTAVLDGPVSFRGAIRMPGQPATAAASITEATDTASPEDAAPRSKRITSLYCVDDVELIHRKRDPQTGRLTQKGRIVGPNLRYNLVTGRFLVDGAGDAWLYKAAAPEPAGTPGQGREGRGQGAGNRATPATGGNPARGRTPAVPDPRMPSARSGETAGQPTTTRTSARQGQSPARGATTPAPGSASDNSGTTRTTRLRPPAGAPAPAPAGEPLELTRIAFHKRVEGRFLADDEEDNPNTPMLATFLGGVQVLNANVADENADLTPDAPPPDFFFVASEKIDVVREAPSPGAPADAPEQFFIDATGGRPSARSPQWSIAANRITYDSLKELVYAYGDENGVLYGHQDRPGQPVSNSTSRALMFNRRTQQVQFIDPRNVLLIDPRSGIRAVPGPSAPPSDSRPPERSNNVDHSLPRIPSSDLNRRGFSGR